MSSKTGDTSHMDFLSLPVSPAAQYSTGGLPQVPGLESMSKNRKKVLCRQIAMTSLIIFLHQLLSPISESPRNTSEDICQVHQDVVLQSHKLLLLFPMFAGSRCLFGLASLPW